MKLHETPLQSSLRGPRSNLIPFFGLIGDVLSPIHWAHFVRPQSFRTIVCFVAAVLAMTVLAGTARQANAAAVDCMNSDAALDYWRPVREQALSSGEVADKLVIELLSCLESPNPELRDQIGFRLFTHWLRGDMLEDPSRRILLAELSAMMAVPPAAGPDNSVFARAFSALVLAEVMRSDSIRPFMTPAERQSLLDQALRSIGRENDYRGLDANLGWIHAVAHMSDLLWRFALHPETTAEQAESILDGVRSQVAPTAAFYSFGESDRLARVITSLITREMVAADNAATWITAFSTPSSMEKWSDAYASPQGMAELHNTKLFLRALADQLDGADTDPAISEALHSIVQELTQML